MRALRLSTAALTPVLLLSACATEPLGPTIPVMPAPNKPFDVFQGDQALCKQYASNEVQGGAQQANNRQVGTAVVGTLLGAGLGAAIGGGHGAAIGAGAGALGGTAVGAGPAQNAQGSLQERYNLCLRAVHVFPREPGSGLLHRPVRPRRLRRAMRPQALPLRRLAIRRVISLHPDMRRVINHRPGINRQLGICRRSSAAVAAPSPPTVMVGEDLSSTDFASSAARAMDGRPALTVTPGSRCVLSNDSLFRGKP